MEEIRIRCQDCGESFIFTANEQRFYEEKNLIPPKRCRFCRQKRKNVFERRNNHGK